MNYLTWLAIKIQLSLVLIANAGNTTPGGETTPGGFTSFNLKSINPFGTCDTVMCIAKAIFRAARIISLPIVIILIMWGAFVLLTSAGDPGRIKSARQIMTWAIVGFIIIIVAEGLANLVVTFLS